MEHASLLVGKRLRIVHPEEGGGGSSRPTLDGRIDLLVPRGAFGSGEHETTASCLELLEALPEVAEARVLDLGSGTGILALAALKLGARSALCVDIDPAAVAAARRTFELNDLSAKRVAHVAGTLADCPEAAGFDLALANLQGGILLGCGRELAARVRPGGILVLSGILWENAWDVRRLLEEEGTLPEKERWLEEYVTLLARRGGLSK
jgi:ribosomal protein L11 methyltransferase